MTVPVARSARELGEQFVQLFQDGDIDALVQLYETDAMFQPAEGQTARGHLEIAHTLQAMRAAGVRVSLELTRISEAGDIAVLSNVATVSDAGTGSRVTTPTIEVARLQTDGTWRYVIDDPSFLSFCT